MVTTFASMVADSIANIPVREGDYQVDGLWYCGNCNTPKQTAVTVNGIIYKPMCLCQCQAERLKTTESEEKARETDNAIERARLDAFPDKRMADYTFDHDGGQDERLMSGLKRYADRFADYLHSGSGIILYGAYSTGKTYAACCVANAILDKGYTVKLTTLTTIVNRMQERFEGRNGILDDLNRYDLLIFDDLGVERQSEYMAEQVFAVIDGRYRSGKPMIVTTNLRLEDMDGTTSRIYSRLKERCIPVEVNFRNFRKEKMQENYKKMKEELFG